MYCTRGLGRFIPSDTTCWMKADTSGSTPNAGAVSGVCKKGKSPPAPPASDDCKAGVCMNLGLEGFKQQLDLALQ